MREVDLGWAKTDGIMGSSALAIVRFLEATEVEPGAKFVSLYFIDCHFSMLILYTVQQS